MCGITGVLNLQERPPVDETVIRQMLEMLRHRGPDGFGVYRDEWIGLGSARLSIIDIAGGDQPIGNEDGSLWVVFNGEIFNYIELRPELEKRGHRFTTQSDTEVLLHLYEEYGPDFLDRLNGQFAIALWDTRRRQLLLARDRAGIRPLYYTLQDGRLLFGSEIKSILAYPGMQAHIDPAALEQVFTYWSVLSPGSIFKEINEVPAAHYLLVKDGQIQTHRYWSLDFSESSPRRPLQEYLDEFESLLIDATRIRLRADVPVGAYLSGGLDSSITAAIIRGYTHAHLDTFSITFADPQFDESEFQLQMAVFLGTDHHVVHASYSEIAASFPEVIWHTETPILRTAPAPMYLLSRSVHQHNYKVVLTGEGADEILGGYDIFKEMKLRRFWAKDPQSELRPLLLERLYPEINGKNGARSGAFMRAFYKKGLEDTASDFYSHAIRWQNTSRTLRFLESHAGQMSSEIQRDYRPVHLPEGYRSWQPLAQAQYLEFTTFLTPYLLSSQGDRMGMANSVEGRYPFLDYRVIEFCNKLPGDLKLSGLREKWLLRQSASKLIPPEIWQRRKRPYRAPVHRSFFNAETPEYVQEMFSSSALRRAGYFDEQPVVQLYAKAQSGLPLTEVEDMALAGILSTQILHHQFVETFIPHPVRQQERYKIIDRVAN